MEGFDILTLVLIDVTHSVVKKNKMERRVLILFKVVQQNKICWVLICHDIILSPSFLDDILRQFHFLLYDLRCNLFLCEIQNMIIGSVP